jgi:hypothetical protein
MAGTTTTAANSTFSSPSKISHQCANSPDPHLLHASTFEMCNMRPKDVFISQMPDHSAIYQVKT